MKRHGLEVIVIIVLAVFLVHCGGRKVVRFDPVTGDVPNCGTSAPVRIVRDAQGVPHIIAGTDEDLFFGLGYTMAQDRFTEMDILRRAAEGRLSELFGSPFRIAGFEIAMFDRAMRIFRFEELGRRGLAEMEPSDRALLDSFCRGINSYLDDSRGTLSFYTGLKIEPAPWKPEDSFASAGLFGLAMTIGGMLEEYYLHKLQRELGPDKAGLFMPYYPDGAPSITEDYEPGTAGMIEPLLYALSGLDALGSNNWAVHGSRTESGRPLLCNDPHVPTFLVPTWWYHVHLKGGSYDVAGMMFPGLPAFGAALNGKTGWTLTNVGADYIDLFREKVNPDNPDQYLADGEWVEFEKKTVEIRLRKKARTETLRLTRHGVVLDPDYLGFKLSAAEGEVLVMKFVDMDFGDFFRGYQMMAKARNWDEFLAGDRLMSRGPFAWNHTYADARGNIGYFTSGRLAVRPDNQGVLPREGWDSKNDWQGYVPFDEMPHLFNPRKGYIATANHRVDVPGYPHYIASSYSQPSRGIRINELIESKRVHGTEDMKRIQYDVAVVGARAKVPLMLEDLALCGDAGCGRAADMLKEWREQGYMAQEDSRGAAVYEVFWQMFGKAVFGDELKDIMGSAGGFAGAEGNALARILNDPDNAWFDDVNTKKRESRQDMTCAVMKKTMKYLKKKLGRDPAGWRWGDINRLSLTPTMVRIPGVWDRRLIGTFGMPGTNETVNASDSVFLKPVGFYNFVGPSTRFIVDFSEPRQFLWNASTGNSENNEGGRYSNTTRAWLDGGYFTLYMDEDKFRQQSMGEVVLLP